jgi:hypothetical protein
MPGPGALPLADVAALPASAATGSCGRSVVAKALPTWLAEQKFHAV